MKFNVYIYACYEPLNIFVKTLFFLWYGLHRLNTYIKNMLTNKMIISKTLLMYDENKTSSYVLRGFSQHKTLT